MPTHLVLKESNLLTQNSSQNKARLCYRTMTFSISWQIFIPSLLSSNQKALQKTVSIIFSSKFISFLSKSISLAKRKSAVWEKLHKSSHLFHYFSMQKKSLNQIESIPSGDYIDNIHTSWAENFALLESHHGYIQWLFPLFESNGMNYQSKKLEKDEVNPLTCVTFFIFKKKPFFSIFKTRPK